MLRVKNAFNSSREILAFLSVVGELVKILKVDTVNEIASLAIVRENKYLAKLVGLRNTIVQADEVKLVNWNEILLGAIGKSILLFIIELKC